MLRDPDFITLSSQNIYGGYIDGNSDVMIDSANVLDVMGQGRGLGSEYGPGAGCINFRAGVLETIWYSVILGFIDHITARLLKSA